MKVIFCISDLQIPLNDRKVVDLMLTAIDDLKPDEIASVGDEVDFPQVSRWTKGMAGEYAGDLQKHVDAGVMFLEALRGVAGEATPIHITRSNHMDRPLSYVRKYAPALLGLRALTIPALLEFDRLGITYHEQPYELAPGWLLMHGDEGGQSQIAGQTAAKLAAKSGMSVVCGHTHRQGILPVTMTAGGKVVKTTYGFEVGNLMDYRRASYMGGGIMNWQKGFGLLYVDGRNVTPVPIPVHKDGSFVVNGKRYGR